MRKVGLTFIGVGLAVLTFLWGILPSYMPILDGLVVLFTGSMLCFVIGSFFLDRKR